MAEYEKDSARIEGQQIGSVEPDIFPRDEFGSGREHKKVSSAGIADEELKNRERKKLVLDDGRISSVREFLPPMQLYEGLLARVRKYHPSADVALIEKAYQVAYNAHKDQVRKSGEPYIIHPLCVALTLAELEMDKETIAAGILHDVVEDTTMTDADMRREFGDDVANLVDGVTKLSKLQFKGDRVAMQAENLRKMFLAMAKDIRVILIKLADRLHNMRTLAHMPPEKQEYIARETADIYAPIANRLGISKVKVELDDLSLKYLHPDVYEDLVSRIASEKSDREAYITAIVDDVTKHIEKAGIKADIDGRIKHFYSIYKKMKNQGKTLDQIYDLFAVRIIVSDVKDCYAALGVIHDMYKPIPGRFKDYIAMPKQNMYQSLHTTLIGPHGIPFEIQIRTYEMHKTAEYGIAAHWKYKETSDGKKPELGEEEKLSWLRQILEWQRDMTDNREFMNLLKFDLSLYSDHVYCFTPQGDVKNLPAGSNPIDFAYSIHSAVGNKMIGARVNGSLVNIDYEIKNGDQIEIITSPTAKGPSRDWLKIVKSSAARSKINQWFKKENKDDNIARGKEAFAAYCKFRNVEPQSLLSPGYMDIILRKYSFKDWDSLYAAIGYGGIKEGQIVNKLIELSEGDRKNAITDDELMANVNEAGAKRGELSNKDGVIVQGLSDVAIKFSKCCAPLPGDDIVGFVTRGSGVSIHRCDCVNVLSLSPEDKHRIIQAQWTRGAEKDPAKKYTGELNIYASNRSGLLVDITRVFSDNGLNITAINSRVSKHGIATITVAFDISSRQEMAQIGEKLKNIQSVIDIERTVS